MPILRRLETPDRPTEPSYDPGGEPPTALRRVGGSLWGLGETCHLGRGARARRVGAHRLVLRLGRRRRRERDRLETRA